MEIKRYGEKEFLSADKLYIRENEIHIWCIRWPEMTDFWKNHEYILSGQELEQAGRFRFPEDRMRYIAGKVVVRILLKRYLDMETIDFSVNELGKPYHKKIAGKRTVDFNISHSGEFILAVFAVGMDIGVDVQEMAECPDYREIAENFYTAEEAEDVKNEPSQWPARSMAPMTPPSVMPACWWILWMPKVAMAAPRRIQKSFFQECNEPYGQSPPLVQGSHLIY